MEKFGGICFYCHSTERLTVDHIEPLCGGGTNAEENLLLACYRCNNERGQMSMTEYLDFRLKPKKVKPPPPASKRPSRSWNKPPPEIVFKPRKLVKAD